MSYIRRSINKSSQRQQIPGLKPSSLSKAANEERLKEIYKSTSIKDKDKSKQKNGRRYYLPIPERKLIDNDLQVQPKSTNRYNRYLQQEETQKHYQQLSHRYHQPQKNKNMQENRQQLSSNLQLNQQFRRKLPKELLNVSSNNEVNKSSHHNIQASLNQLNQNLAKNKNSRKTYNIIEQQQNPQPKRYRIGSIHQEKNPYQNEMFKIRKSAKKSFSGSLSKKPSQGNMRQDTRVENSRNLPSTKSQLASPKQSSDFLEQGKSHFKQGQLRQAMRCFEKGMEQQPKNLNYAYNIALVYLKQHNYQQGLKVLEGILQANPSFKKTTFLFAVISAKHLGQLQRSLQLANHGLSLYPSFLDLLNYRSKLHTELNQPQCAISDLQQVLQLQKNHIEANYMLAFMYFQQQLMTHAMSQLTAAIYHDQDKGSECRYEAIKLSAKIHLAQGKVKQAAKDIKRLRAQKSNKGTAQLLYLTGKLQMLQNKASQAVISFEKCLREKPQPYGQSTNFPLSQYFPETSPSSYLIPALLQICKTKIDIKDFYSAYHHVNRAKNYGSVDLNDLSLVRFRYFIEGVVFLMKRKIDDGMRNLSKFIQAQNKTKQHLTSIKQTQTPTSQPSLYILSRHLEQQLTYFYPQLYLYRAFGYFMQNKHQQAIKDYEQYEQVATLDKYTLYNLNLARGIDQIAQGEFEKAVGYFDKAEGLFVKSEVRKVEPYIYRAITKIEEGRVSYSSKLQSQAHSSQHQTQIHVLQLVFQALKQLDKAYDINDSNSNLLFIRSLIYAYLNKFQQSLDDIIKAITKSQENVPKYFFFRGLLQATLQNNKQALNDYNIAINLDTGYAQVYLERAKMYFRAENYAKALEDLVRFGDLRPEEDVEYHKAVLYMVNGLYPMAEQTSQLIKNQSAPQFRQLRFHILLKVARLPQAQAYLISQSDRLLVKILSGDLTQIAALLKQQQPITSQKDLKYFNLIQYYHFLGVAYFSLGQYERALQQFTIALKQCQLRDLERSSSGYSSTKKNATEESQAQVNGLGEKDSNCITYNIFLCHLKMAELRKAYEVFIKEIMPVNEKLQKSEFMTNFSHLLFRAMKRASSPRKGQKSLQAKPQQSPPHMLQANYNDIQQAHIQLFSNHYTSIYSQQTIIQTATFVLRTKLCLLNIQSQDLRRQYNGKLWPEKVMTWLNVKEVENRPEPPWVKRHDEGLVFTDDVRDVEIEFQTTQHDEEEEENQEEEEENEEDDEVDYDEHEDDEGQSNEESLEKKKFDLRKLKDQMRLDDSIERKLNRIVNKSKEKE